MVHGAGNPKRSKEKKTKANEGKETREEEAIGRLEMQEPLVTYHLSLVTEMGWFANDHELSN
jgi:hypothetical protein